VDGTRGPAERARRAVDQADLVQRVGRGDAGALADLYDQTCPFVYGLAFSILQSPSLATRLTQEIYADLWRRAPRYDPRRGNPLAWLLSTAHRRLAEEIQASGRGSAPERYAALNDGRGFGHVTTAGGARRIPEPTRTAWCSLPPVSREAVALSYFGGYRQIEVAHILGLTLDAVATSIRDGLVALRAARGER